MTRVTQACDEDRVVAVHEGHLFLFGGQCGGGRAEQPPQQRGRPTKERNQSSSRHSDRRHGSRTLLQQTGSPPAAATAAPPMTQQPTPHSAKVDSRECHQREQDAHAHYSHVHRLQTTLVTAAQHEALSWTKQQPLNKSSPPLLTTIKTLISLVGASRTKQPTTALFKTSELADFYRQISISCILVT